MRLSRVASAVWLLLTVSIAFRALSGSNLKNVPVPIRIVVLSTSHRAGSRSEKLAERCRQLLADRGAEVTLVSLKEHDFPPLVVDCVSDSEAYKALYPVVAEADGIVFSSPVYNWSLSSALKQFIEHVGSTDGTLKSALFDKVVSFVCSGGLPQGYMAFGQTALSLMLDFRCVINPYQVFVHEGGWGPDGLSAEDDERLRKGMAAMLELTTLLARRTYRSEWSV